MGLCGWVRSITLTLGALGMLQATPMLRLVNTTVGPVSVAAASNGSTRTVEAYNAGDGALTLAATSSVSWLVPTVGAAAACTTTTAASSCQPIAIALNTASLATSSTAYTGIITVTSPTAADAPQTITVTVQMGGGVPSSVTAYVAPGSSADVPFSTNNMIQGQATTQDGNHWLSLALQGVGSFRFVLPYSVHIVPQANQTSGTFNGTLTTSGSPIAGENKAIAVTMNVTSQPIAQASTSEISMKLAQGAPAGFASVSLSNTGLGTLSVQSLSATGQGVTAAVSGVGALLTFNTGSLAPGDYPGSVTLNTNAANGNITVPVDFVVEAKGAPTLSFQSVVDNAIFGAGDALAPGDIAVVFGDQMFFGALTSGQAPPLATTIGTTQVLVNGQPAPLFYASYGQIAFQIPTTLTAGTAIVQVVRDSQTSNSVSVGIASRAPRLLQIGVGTYGAIVNSGDSSFPLPAGALPGANTHPAKAGDTIVIYGIGMGPTNPSVATGAPAPSSAPLAQVIGSATVLFGDSIAAVPATPFFVGLTPTYSGLYQVNVTIPDNAPKGTIDMRVQFADSISNPVQIAIQ